MTNPSGGRARNGVGLVLLALIVGCGRGGLDAPDDFGDSSVPADAGSGVPVSSGIPDATRVNSLSDAQRRSLCDFINQRQGGYNHTVRCPSGEVQTDVDQSACDDALNLIGGACPTLTAGAINDCAAGPGGNLCTFETAPECKALLVCLTSL